MLINSDFLLPHLQNKKWHKKTTNDRHIICPKCKVRTKLYKLKDQRRKCSRCDKKFVAKRKIEQRLPKQNADTIVGFCLDFSALKTAKSFNYRYSFVLGTYNKIRYILTKESLMDKQLSGIVEVDESYFGGVNRKRSKKYRKKYVGRGRGTDKTPVFGIIERGDKVFIDILKDLTRETVEAIITKKVKPGSNVMSDEFQSYKGLIYKGYIHRFVEHGKEQYAKGQVHVNGIENFWSWAKEHMIKFHGIFRHNLIYYLKEIEWKFNHRIPFDRLKGIVHEAKNIGMRNFDISGGEFLLHKDWEKILTLLIENGFYPYLSTKVPINEKTIIKLQNIGIKSIQVSIDSIIEEEVIAMLNVKNGYIDKLKKTLKLLDKSGIEITTNSIITKYNSNLDSIQGTFNFLASLQNIKRINFAVGGFSIYSKEKYINYKLDINDINRIEKYIEEKRNDYNGKINISFDYFYTDIVFLILKLKKKNFLKELHVQVIFQVL